MRFGDVSRVANASVGDERDVRSADRLRRFVNRGDLRHTDAGDDPRRADRSRPDADFHRVGAGVDQVAASFARRHVAGHDVDVPALLDLADRLDHVGRVAVGAVDDQEVDVLGDQAAGPLKIKHTDRGSHPQPTLPVFGCLREAPHHVDVFDRNQSGQSVIFVNQQKLLDLFCHQNLLSLLKRYGPLCCHQVVAGHHFGDGQVVMLEKTQVAAGDDAHQLAVFDDRNAADFRLLHRLRAR